MAVGAIGGISAPIYNPYIYNTRNVSSASLDSVKRISDDATQGGVDFSKVNEDKPENINPLKKGETVGFADILMSQMSMSSVKQTQLFASDTSMQSQDNTSAYMFNKAFEAYGIA